MVSLLWCPYCGISHLDMSISGIGLGSNWRIFCVIILLSVGILVAMKKDDSQTSLRRYTHPNIKYRAPWMSTVIVDEDTGLIYISGLVVDNIVDIDGSRAPEAQSAKGNAKQEALAVLGVIQKVLAALDVSMSGIMNCVVHLRDVEADFSELNEAFAHFFPDAGSGPTRTTVQAGGRIVRGCLLEISVTAKRAMRGSRSLPPDGLLEISPS